MTEMREFLNGFRELESGNSYVFGIEEQNRARNCLRTLRRMVESVLRSTEEVETNSRPHNASHDAELISLAYAEIVEKMEAEIPDEDARPT